MWVFRYVGLLFEWAFTHWRKHQGIVGLVVSVLIGLGILTAAGVQKLGVYLACWLVVLVFVIAPARLWRDYELRATAKIRFIDHRDNRAIEPINGETIYLRVTVESTAPNTPLTGAQIVLAEMNPMPGEFMTLAVPLVPLHRVGVNAETNFTLRPRFPQTVDVAYASTEGEGVCHLFHNVATVPHDVPDGTYRVRLVATANETTPTEQMATLELRHDEEHVEQWVQYRLTAFSLTLDPSV